MTLPETRKIMADFFEQEHIDKGIAGYKLGVEIHKGKVHYPAYQVRTWRQIEGKGLKRIDNLNGK